MLLQSYIYSSVSDNSDSQWESCLEFLQELNLIYVSDVQSQDIVLMNGRGSWKMEDKAIFHTASSQLVFI